MYHNLFIHSTIDAHLIVSSICLYYEHFDACLLMDIYIHFSWIIYLGLAFLGHRIGVYLALILPNSFQRGWATLSSH